MAGISKIAKKMGLSEADAAEQIRSRLQDPETLRSLGEAFQLDMDNEEEVNLFLELIAVKIAGDEEAFQEKAVELNLIGRMQKMGLL